MSDVNVNESLSPSPVLEQQNDHNSLSSMDCTGKDPVQCIDDWVQKYIQLKNGPTSSPIVGPFEEVVETVQLHNFTIGGTRPFDNTWHVLQTGKDGTCGLHAILNALSPTYRQQPDDIKTQIGQTFRQTFFSTLFAGSDADTIANVQNLGYFLREEQLSRLADHLGIDIMYVVIPNQSPANGLSEQEAALRLHPEFNKSGRSDRYPWIFILNTGMTSSPNSGHYSTIYKVDTITMPKRGRGRGQKTVQLINKYMFDIDDVAPFLRNPTIRDLYDDLTTSNIEEGYRRIDLDIVPHVVPLSKILPRLQSFIQNKLTGQSLSKVLKRIGNLLGTLTQPGDDDSEGEDEDEEEERAKLVQDCIAFMKSLLEQIRKKTDETMSQTETGTQQVQPSSISNESEFVVTVTDVKPDGTISENVLLNKDLPGMVPLP